MHIILKYYLKKIDFFNKYYIKYKIIFTNQEQNISDELELIVDVVKLDYDEVSDIVAMNFISLEAQQPIKNLVELGNMFQDVKIASINSYGSTTNKLRDDMTKLHSSSKNTKEALIANLSGTRDNISKNNKEQAKLKGENKKLDDSMKVEAQKLQSMLNNTSLSIENK